MIMLYLSPLLPDNCVGTARNEHLGRAHMLLSWWYHYCSKPGLLFTVCVPVSFINIDRFSIVSLLIPPSFSARHIQSCVIRSSEHCIRDRKSPKIEGNSLVDSSIEQSTRGAVQIPSSFAKC
jgi:hypothetical protein